MGELDVVERYLEAIGVTRDWEALRECLAEDFTRVGPYGDTYTSRSEYLEFIAVLMPKLPGYQMRIDRVRYATNTAYAELTETVTIDGEPYHTPETLVFDLTSDGRIAGVRVFIQTPGRSMPKF
jgi:ketosteroid isomerase-like protein